ncbi:hypothetical protein FPV67DRAFT_1462695 [Lyophyllum atratum]|nr:hypothetical protein FPV67DRAFT_1462695 [Lyophyllum atratum]
MSAFARLLRPPPSARRTYSSFFSSRSGGGGRYFNSAKPPKVVVTSNAAKANTSKGESNTEAPTDGAQTPAKGSPGAINANADQSSTASSSSPSTSTPSAPSSGKTTEAPDASGSSPGWQTLLHRQQHPVVNAKDFKLHQFFSLHRPLLLLAHPASILESASTTSFDSPEVSTADADANANTATPQWLLDEFPEATLDADAAAARQLTRALTMSHAGAAMAWEDTLRRLGIDVNEDADRVGLRAQMDKELHDVMMDSVKRKRRKKMKKHKLKKRRKATRATRLKIGR